MPIAPAVAAIVLVGQIVVGSCLVVGRKLHVGLAVGIFLNLHFMAAGAVTPSAFYLLAQGALALWLCERNSTRFGVHALWATAAAAVFLVGVHLPLISTLHPAEVIEDPAVMFVFGGALTTLACLLALSAPRRHIDRHD